MQSTQPLMLKVAIVGSGGVGKSALTLQFMYDEFIEDYEPTKADSYRKADVIDGEKVIFDILDTAGQEDYFGVRDYFFRSSDGFLLVYSINDLESLEALSTLREQVVRIKNCDRPPMLIVANKIDLCNQLDKHYIQEGLNLAKSWGVKFVETSAKECRNVDIIFHDIGRSIRRQKMDCIQYPKTAQARKSRRRCTIL